MKKKVLVPLAQGCEELEAITIIDLLRRAEIEVITAGLDGKPVTASRGVKLIPDTTLDEAILQHTVSGFDLIVLPGGLPGADHLNDDPRIHSLLQAQVKAHKNVAAICAAPKVLVSAGVVNEKKITAYPGALSALDLRNITLSEEAVITDGNITTSRGPGTAMDFALDLIEQLAGKPKRDEVEAGLVR